MNILVQRDALLKPLQALSGVVERKQTLPILSNILLRLQENNLLLIGTDLEVELVGFVGVEQQLERSSVEQQTEPQIDEPTAITVSARKLFDICRALPEGCMLHLSLEKQNLVVRAGESYFMLNTMPAQDFPALESCEYPIEFTLKQGQLKKLLSKTYFAMAQQDVRHFLNGAYIEINQQSIKCVTADGHRLALTTITDASLDHHIQVKMILPRKSVLELIRLFSAEEGEVSIRLNDNRIQFIKDDYIFTSKMINAQYPDYNRLIPKGNAVATGDRESIKQALTRASILSNEKFRGVRFQLENSKLLITANNTDQEQAEEVVVWDYAGKNLEIGFNVAYLLDVMSAVTTQAIRCIFTGPDDGVLIEPVDEDDQSLYVVMPMRI